MNDQLRKRMYALLIVIAAAIIAGRIIAAELVYEPSVPRKWPATKPRAMPTFSSNDRSRWATVRALIDGDPENGQPPGTFVVGTRGGRTKKQRHETVAISAALPLVARDAVAAASLAVAAFEFRIQGDRGIIFEDGWQSVDKVLHPGELEFLSSKPPLLSVLMAGLYWLLQQLTGWRLATDPFAVVRVLLLLVNWLPFILYLVLLTRLLERYGKTDWGRLFVLAGACFATLVSPFAITFNNHSLAVYSVVFALYPALGILEARSAARTAGSQPNQQSAWYSFALAGLFAGFTATCELPAAAFAAALFVILLWWSPRRTLLIFVPAVLIPVAAFFYTNYKAVGQIGLAYGEFGGPWYEYEGSHWRRAGEVKTGIDWAWTKETTRAYALHVLFGHHGLFSLTPLWILALLGMLRVAPGDLGFWLTGKNRQSQVNAAVAATRRILSLLAALTLTLTVVVVGFYLFGTDVKTHNYGGWTCGLRWLLWLSPLWLLTLLPIADALAPRRWGRTLAYVLLGISIFSATYPSWNPWRHPWLYRLTEALGWPGY
jgi:hypothetical protein